jgi:hypothetical protein
LIIIAAALLFVSLGVYVYLGRKADGLLVKLMATLENGVKRGGQL